MEIAGAEFVVDSLAGILKHQANVDVIFMILLARFLDFLEGPRATAVLEKPDFDQAVEHVHVSWLEVRNLKYNGKALCQHSWLVG